MSNDLVTPGDLEGFPGAPFTDAEVDTAVSLIRDVAGWHIAPVRDETVVLDVVVWERWLRLPTLQLVQVTEVRDVLDPVNPAVIDPSSYRVSHKLAQIKHSCGFWPAGYEAAAVDMSHGYEECPPDLFAVIADVIVRGRTPGGPASSVRLGELSITDGTLSYSSSVQDPTSLEAILARYTLPKDGWA